MKKIYLYLCVVVALVLAGAGGLLALNDTKKAARTEEVSRTAALKAKNGDAVHGRAAIEKLVRGNKNKGKLMSNVTVSGAGTSGYNGVYVPYDTANGAVRYRLDATHWLGFNNTVGPPTWSLGSSAANSSSGLPPSSAYSVTSGASASVIPTTGWFVGSAGASSPAPTLSIAPTFATPTPPKLTNIITNGDNADMDLTNISPWDASWTEPDHRLVFTLTGGGVFALNSTDTVVPFLNDTKNIATSHKFQVADSGGVESTETKIVTCPRIGYEVWDLVVPDTLPSGGHTWNLEANFHSGGRQETFATAFANVSAGDRLRLRGVVPNGTAFRYKCEFAPGYGGQGGSDEFSYSAAVAWPGTQNAAFFMAASPMVRF